MANFIENLPEYSHQQGVTYKHVTLMSELSHAVERRGLMAVSGVEQEVACQAPAPAAHNDAVAALVGSPGVTEEDRLRLVLLYALRYERDGQAQVAALLRTLGEQGEGWSAGMRIVLGGTSVQSSSTFLKDFQEVMLNERYAS